MLEGCSSRSSQDPGMERDDPTPLTWPIPRVWLLGVFSRIRLLRLLWALQSVSGLCSRRGKTAGHQQRIPEAAFHGGCDHQTSHTGAGMGTRRGDSPPGTTPPPQKPPNPPQPPGTPTRATPRQRAEPRSPRGSICGVFIAT